MKKYILVQNAMFPCNLLISLARTSLKHTKRHVLEAFLELHFEAENFKTRNQN